MTRFYPLYNGEYDETLIRELTQGLGVSPLTARALIRRGVDGVDSGEAFLRPTEQQLLDPCLLPDMDRAVARIRLGVERGEQICVYGDYDADGVCATAILLRCLRNMGAKAVPYIPARQTEGYGMNPEAVRRLAGRYITLIVTVDNGVSAFDEIALCRNSGIDVVVTDHHSTGAALPMCCAVVAASRRDSAYPNPYLCGAGVALKLASALLPEADHRDDLALAALATVADVVPLLGENRAIVSLGLPGVAKQSGLSALLHVAGAKDGAVDARTLAFFIAPRLNAAGRMGDAMRCVELLLTADSKRGNQLAAELDRDNTARKAIEEEIFHQAEKDMDDRDRALIGCAEGWNPGVIGIVASRLCEQYHRPAILFSEKDGVLVGSGRSPEGIDLYKTLTGLSRYFTRYGGHARAAGITMPTENFTDFQRDFLLEMAGYDESCFLPACGYEEKLSLSALTLPAVKELAGLAPFGAENPEPVYLIEDARICNASTMGKDGTHLSALVRQNGTSMRLVAFRQGDRAEWFQRGIPMDLLIRPTVNRFREKETLELYWEADAAGAQFCKVFRAIVKELMYNGSWSCDTLTEWLRLTEGAVRFPMDRERMAEQYRGWRLVAQTASVSAPSLPENYGPEALTAFLIFCELGFFALDEQGTVCAVTNARNRDLTESKLFRALRDAKN